MGFQYPVVLTRAAWERCVVIPPRLLCGSAVERAFSPDSRFLAVWYSVWASKHPLEVWDLKPGVSRPLIALDDAAAAPEFSPDGRTIAVGMPDDSVRLFDLASSREARHLAVGLTPSRLAFHPDGHKLAVASTSQPGVQVYDLESGQVLFTLPHPRGVQAVAAGARRRLPVALTGDSAFWTKGAFNVAAGRPTLPNTGAALARSRRRAAERRRCRPVPCR